MRKIFNYFLLCSMLLLYSCSKDSPTENKSTNGVIQGTVRFLDGSLGVSSVIQLKALPTNKRQSVVADENGIYKFENLTAGSYVLIFESTGYEINPFEKEISLASDEVLNQDIYIVYNLLDESLALKINREIVFIRFQPEGAKIGQMYNIVDRFSGFFRRDIANSSTLSCDVYELPDTVKWTSPGESASSEYIRGNFTYLSTVEEVFTNGTHQINFTGDQIPMLLSNPENGFAFVAKEGDERDLKIPCVDFSNNDFGLLIYYK